MNGTSSSALDGLYVIRTSVGAEAMDAAACVRSHLLLCLLAYYVEWHMREARRELTFADPHQGAKATRDPGAPDAAQTRASRHTLPDGTPAHSFSTLLADLATIVRNTCRTPSDGPEAPTFDVVTTPTAKLTTPTATQQRAFALIRQIAV